ncbi:hypothetical protein [Desulfovibrio desulfuricans]|uniref:hypothetical protein n=1 Tax=Desulfovibrio desulfuricans TaxID=876 RepID=UPI001C03A0D8|nr:hypothetical protein [Desulfovibrio desulfuricans]MBT9749220.1 hypothetical protein [Desulfovibrio desulfuricans]
MSLQNFDIDEYRVCTPRTLMQFENEKNSGLYYVEELEECSLKAQNAFPPYIKLVKHGDPGLKRITIKDYFSNEKIQHNKQYNCYCNICEQKGPKKQPQEEEKIEAPAP